MASFLPLLTGVRFCILAPLYREAAGRFPRTVLDPERHARILAGLQRLRGSVLRSIDRISASVLTPDGRHVCRFDEQCWHLVAEDEADRVIACVRVLRHRDGYDIERGLCGTFLARMEPSSCRQYAAALANMAQEMRERKVEVADFSSLVADRDYPNKVLGPVLTLGSVAMLAGCTERFLGVIPAHQYASGLYRRLGGQPLTLDGRELPAFDDSLYRGMHEILLIDACGTYRPPAGSLDTAREVRDRLLQSLVICRAA
jgi:hypothetical protein